MLRKHVIMFSARFATAVAVGEKRQTIRPPRVRSINPGDVLVLRAWEDRPYRSRQIDLSLRVCREVYECFLSADFVMVDGVGLSIDSHDKFARLDGFADWAAMRSWFETTHGLPFRGQIIRW